MAGSVCTALCAPGLSQPQYLDERLPGLCPSVTEEGYTLIETGMRRAAVTHLDLPQTDLAGRRLTVVEKGGATHTYQMSQEGIRAIQDYLVHERAQDAARWPSPALFLAA